MHSAWVGIEEQGKPGLNQLFMKDFYGMWLAHKKDPSKYPELARIRDDNGDGMIEVNRPEEIDALLAATAAHLKATAFPMNARRLVYVSDDRKYTSGAAFEVLPMEPHEASPYASVYKYSHNVLPARAALGAKGCTDCHAYQSVFFEGRNLQRPFDENGASVWLANHEVIGLSKIQVRLGALREATLKPALHFVLCLLALVGAGIAVRILLRRLGSFPAAKARRAGWVAAGLGLLALAASAWSPRLLSYMTFDRFTLDANHFWISLVVLAGAALLAISLSPGVRKSTLMWALIVAALTGALMIGGIWWLSYTLFDTAVLLLAALLVLESARILIKGDENLGFLR
ncbi:MAG: hypothetical protein IPP47_33320 [Bryobacterales bacterium]|nr:hypothetical protein [Bryobacterales bacterium]